MSKTNITVVGLVKKTKEEFAQILAEKLEMCFVDVDSLSLKETSSLKEVLDNFGSKYYEKIENESLERIKTFDNSVITTNLQGLFSHDNLMQIKKCSLILYLQINFKTFKKLNSEVAHQSKSKLIMNEIVFAERDKLYCENADIIVDASSLKLKNILKNAIKAIKKYYKKLKK